MARFCTQCGRRLEDGEVCTCGAAAAGNPAQAASQQAPQYQSAPQSQPNQQAPQYQSAPQSQPNQQAPQYQSAPQTAQYQSAPQQPQGQSSQQAPQYQSAPQSQPNQQAAQYQSAPQQTVQSSSSPQYQQAPQYQSAPQQTQGQFYQQAPQGQPNPQAAQNQQYQQAAQDQQYQQTSQNQQYQQAAQNQQYQQGPQGQTQQAEWFNETKDTVVSGTKSMFAEIVPILKAPVTRIRELVSEENHVVGIGFISAKTIAAILVYLIGIISMFARPFYRSLVVPYIPVFFMGILITGGADFLEAFLLKLFSGLFKGKTTFKSMLALVGGRALYQVPILLVCGLIMIGSRSFGETLLLILCVFTFGLEYASYQGSVEMEENKKLYAFASAKACTLVAIFIVNWIFMLFVNIIANTMSGLNSIF